MPNTPETTIRTSHAVSIKADGVTVGQIQTWAPTQSRTVTPTYQLGADIRDYRSGDVYENVPGNVTNLTIRVDRFDLYQSRMEQVWGIAANIQMLGQQTASLEIDEMWRHPDQTIERYVYSGCWFTSLGRTLSAVGDRIVNVNATLQYVKVRQLIGG